MLLFLPKMPNSVISSCEGYWSCEETKMDKRELDGQEEWLCRGWMQVPSLSFSHNRRFKIVL